ncbi:precorrin-2 dehydrogenase/sirohydrochlorin ferrochelatase family protein [Enterococcus sp. CWB-B31]|uniref:precorrin-2 dehydrogenase/sirohydrochlorin ferrochelatase family protein n=1 Tax=Enterococcus sp. CWB-B31 TaxID=2885159 RepID=UPI001E55A89E|nr:bifunctional precorrin-2 dehydrogenase/sirohydrochlorin ferrochelatase [Enterococcus sp. CWB-B31]MCB5954699.1 bifunctional precorrin-2 dehydrogenase/sirohydrochlorin ferrochelatase [Enterococcus sp. CWB-B31]
MYPIMIDLTNKKIVVIGGGTIALRKVEHLLAAGGRPTVIALEIKEEFQLLEEIELIKASYQKEQLKEAQLIFACTDSKAVNQRIVDDAEDWQWVNDCSQKKNSDFFNMAVIENEEVLIALSSSGKSPANIKQVKNHLKEFLEKESKQ